MEFPNFGYVKEEYQPVIQRMSAYAQDRPAMKGVLSGAASKGMLHQMRLDFDGTVPGAPFADVCVRIWNLYQNGKHDEARDAFGKLLLVVNLDQEIPGTRQYAMKNRQALKTLISRRINVHLSREAIVEIDFIVDVVRPYFISYGSPLRRTVSGGRLFVQPNAQARA